MLQTEYVRNLNCNYERILLEKKPEENRYQYCIVGRGGIKRLLPCSLRYINGEAYLYYDISSMQNIAQLYSGRVIKRNWVKDFLWSMKKVRQELDRFLLDDHNLIWYPEHIFQDLDKKDFSFLYYPYYEGETGFKELLNYLVERIDYEDEGLVECVYTLHERYEMVGEPYLAGQIFEDARKLEEERSTETMTEAVRPPMVSVSTASEHEILREETSRINVEETTEDQQKKGFRYFFEGRKRKQKEERLEMRKQAQQLMTDYAVAEKSSYFASGTESMEEDDEEEEEFGRTVYMEEKVEEEPKAYRLMTPEGKLVYTLERPSVLIGKKKGEADCVLEDAAISRLHARITREEDSFYLEDLNSTNGTFKNGLRMRPYEKRKLQEEDEIRLGKTTLIFR